jgi:NifU-like protein involved in Fe-S cluster formation
VEQARFRTYGCPACIAAAEALCAWAEGRAVEELAVVTAAMVTAWLDGVPEGKEHCPALAAEAARAVREDGERAPAAEVEER